MKKGATPKSTPSLLPAAGLVRGWNCFDDDSHQRCDSVNLKSWIRDPDPANADESWMTGEEIWKYLPLNARLISNFPHGNTSATKIIQINHAKQIR
ncbi:hypothetical protein [Variovorax sp. GT1P44]|uniref:hypothetical protein n=1 Tax=Variovorax sp. GT1P44 TaxID=3443742 RepID=UPI003F450E23